VRRIFALVPMTTRDFTPGPKAICHAWRAAARLRYNSSQDSRSTTPVYWRMQ
jgi:hypothetical protein